MKEKWQKNILRFLILQPMPQSKKSGFGDSALSRIAPCFGASVTAEAIVFRDNAKLSPDIGFSAVIFRAAGQTAYTFWSQYAYVTSKVLGPKQPKETLSGPAKWYLFLSETLFFFFFLFLLFLAALCFAVSIFTWRYASWWAAWG